MKHPPAYGVTSVDHALRLAVILQVEGPLTVSEAAERLGVARSTAHRLLSTLVYRDFAAQNADRSYRVGPVLELAARTRSDVAALRAAALGPMRTLVDVLDETANLSVRTGRTVRFIASVECSRRSGAAGGRAWSSRRTRSPAALGDDELSALYAPVPGGGPEERPDLARLRAELRAVRRSGVALNLERSERGVVAVGRGVTGPDGDPVAAVAVSTPSVRHSPRRLKEVVAALTTASRAISAALAGEPGPGRGQ